MSGEILGAARRRTLRNREISPSRTLPIPTVDVEMGGWSTLLSAPQTRPNEIMHASAKVCTGSSPATGKLEGGRRSDDGLE